MLDLSKKNLKIREEKKKGVYIENITEIPVYSYNDIIQIIEKGNHGRTVASTDMNSVSSRSHAIVTISMQQQNRETLISKTSKLNLVDLAGSECVKKTKYLII